jgi:uracil-DNA glycosylase
MPLFAHVDAQQPSKVPCPIAFVTDAPDDTAVCRGEPMCGPAGRLFDKMLRLAGIERSECWVGSVFDEKIPGGDIRKWCVAKEADLEADAPRVKVPSNGFLKPEYHWHFERLAAELEASKPSIIVPMGGTALWAFVGSTAITASRGAVTRASGILPGAKLLPTFAPGYVHQSYKHLVTVVGDMQKALAEATQPAETLRLSPRELWLAPDLADIEEFFTRFLVPSDLITLDIETAAGQITEFGASADSERSICIPFVDYRRVDRCFWPQLSAEVAAWQWVQRICSLPQPKLFQNGPYDMFYLTKAGFSMNNYREDTRLLHHALYPELPKSLEYMGSVYCHQGPWKQMGWSGKAKRDA